MKKQVIVIGAGISGLSISRMLSEKYQVQVLEKSERIGGLIKCDRIDGNLFHRVGGHVFNSKNQDILNWFWKHFDRDNEFLKAVRNAKILMNDELVGYPIENYLYQLPEKFIQAITAELIDILKKGNNEEETYNNFKDFLLAKFGKTLYYLYFHPYNRKIWNTDISKVPLEWLDGKLPMPKIEEVILSNILRKEERGMVHSTFYYPKRDGSQFIINRLAESLDITSSYDVTCISTVDNKISINNNNLESDVLVYCGDVRKLTSIINIDDTDLKDALSDVTHLPSNGTSNVLCETDPNDISWLYLPEDKFKAHRIIYTGNFSETNNEGTDRKTCVVEFSGNHGEAEMIKELALLPGNLKPLAFNYEPNSYIIQHPDTRSKIGTLKKLLKKYNIYLLGRFAEWEYYNMDKAIESAMELSSIL
jgi:protoporphyrinogen oxidase